VLRLLEKHEYPAPRLRKLANGGVLTKYHEKSVLVKPYIAGHVEAEIDNEKAKQVGSAVAKLHEIPAPDFLPDEHSYVEIVLVQREMEFWPFKIRHYTAHFAAAISPIGRLSTRDLPSACLRARVLFLRACQVPACACGLQRS
jgi:hypothetical protein